MSKYSHGLEVLGAIDVTGAFPTIDKSDNPDAWRQVGRAWGMAHDVADPYVTQVTTAVPHLKTFTDAGDTIYTTYRGATGEQTTKQKAQVIIDKAKADKAASDAAIKAAGGTPPGSAATQPQGQQPGQQAQAKAGKKVPTWAWVAGGVGVLGVGICYTLAIGKEEGGVMGREKLTAAQKLAIGREIIDREIAEGLKDVREGRIYGPFDTADDMIASLNANTKRKRKK